MNIFRKGESTILRGKKRENETYIQGSSLYTKFGKFIGLGLVSSVGMNGPGGLKTRPEVTRGEADRLHLSLLSQA